VSADTRDLNYGMYEEKGEKELSQEVDYTSENTERLDVDGMVELLMKLDYIKDELKG
jgi:UDP-glucose 4-epimerase